MKKFHLKPDLLGKTLNATTTAVLEEILRALPINEDYVYDRYNPSAGWIDGKLHWVPVGLEPGNAGRIKLGVDPDNRIAERVVNGIEAIIELARRESLKVNPNAPPPASPRAAVLEYFGLPRLDEIPGLNDDRKTEKRARELQKKVRVKLVGYKVGQRVVERALVVEDDGIGQAPTKLHTTILSLGGDNKIKEPYLIGMWGQGGSSALASAAVTWIVSRRAPQLEDAEDRVAWTVVKEIHPPGSGRRSYYAYLASAPTGEVASIDAAAADALEFRHGTRIGHLRFDIGNMEAAKLYQAMNHILPNPVLPFQINTRTELRYDPIWGLGYLLSKKTLQKETSLDKRFDGRPVVMTKEED